MHHHLHAISLSGHSPLQQVSTTEVCLVQQPGRQRSDGCTASLHLRRAHLVTQQLCRVSGSQIPLLCRCRLRQHILRLGPPGRQQLPSLHTCCQGTGHWARPSKTDTTARWLSPLAESSVVVGRYRKMGICSPIFAYMLQQP